MELLGYFTSKGESLSAKLLTGTALTITRVAAGDGETSADAAALIRDCQALPAGTMLRSGTTVTLPVTLTAALAAESYILREIGVYAEDPEEGEILYRIYRLSQPVNVNAGGQLTIRFQLQETVSEAAEVTVSGTPAGLLTVADRGVPAGVAALDETGIVPPSQLPYAWGTEDLEDGVSALTPGRLYFVYAAGTASGGNSGGDSGTSSDAGSFTVAGIAYTADPGMTWNEWISSLYYVEGSWIVVNDSGTVVNGISGLGLVPAQKGTDVIAAGGTYVWETAGSDMG